MRFEGPRARLAEDAARAVGVERGPDLRSGQHS